MITMSNKTFSNDDKWLNLTKEYTKQEVLDEIQEIVEEITGGIDEHFMYNEEGFQLTSGMAPPQRDLLSSDLDTIYMYGDDDDIKTAVYEMIDDINNGLSGALIVGDEGDGSVLLVKSLKQLNEEEDY